MPRINLNISPLIMIFTMLFIQSCNLDKNSFDENLYNEGCSIWTFEPKEETIAGLKVFHKFCKNKFYQKVGFLYHGEEIPISLNKDSIIELGKQQKFKWSYKNEIFKFNELEYLVLKYNSDSIILERDKKVYKLIRQY